MRSCLQEGLPRLPLPLLPLSSPSVQLPWVLSAAAHSRKRMRPVLSCGHGYQWSEPGGLLLPAPPAASCKQKDAAITMHCNMQAIKQHGMLQLSMLSLFSQRAACCYFLVVQCKLPRIAHCCMPTAHVGSRCKMAVLPPSASPGACNSPPGARSYSFAPRQLTVSHVSSTQNAFPVTPAPHCSNDFCCIA